MFGGFHFRMSSMRGREVVLSLGGMVGQLVPLGAGCCPSCRQVTPTKTFVLQNSPGQQHAMQCWIRVRSRLVLLFWPLMYHFSLLKSQMWSKNADVAPAGPADRNVGHQVEIHWACDRPLVGRGGSVQAGDQTASSGFFLPAPRPLCTPTPLLYALRYHRSGVWLHPEEPQDDRGAEPWLPDGEEHQPAGVQAGHHVPEHHRHQAHCCGVQAAAVHPPQHPPAEGVRLLRHLEGGEVQALGLALLEGPAARAATAQPECRLRLEWELLLPVWHQPWSHPEEKESVERSAWAAGSPHAPGLHTEGQAPGFALLGLPVLWDLLPWRQQTEAQAAGGGWAQVGDPPLQGRGAGGAGQEPPRAPACTGPSPCPLPLQRSIEQQWLLCPLAERWSLVALQVLSPWKTFTGASDVTFMQYQRQTWCLSTLPHSLSGTKDCSNIPAVLLLMIWARDLQRHTEQQSGLPMLASPSP